MEIFVSGGTGFIGSYLIQELLKTNNNITIFTRNQNFKSDNSIKNLRFEVCDIYNIENKFIKNNKIPDLLIHLAWGGLPNYKSNFHFEFELPNQYQFLSSFIKAGLKNLFVTGTCFEYGMREGLLSENLISIPSNPYGFAKDTLRRQLEFLQVDYPFNLTWGRLFYMFGENQSEKSIYSLLKKAISNKEKEFPMSGGEQIRDYLSIEEIASIIKNLSLKNANLGLVNICSGNPTSIRRLVESWITTNNWNIKLKLDVYPYPDYEPFAFWGDTTKLKSII